MDRVTPDVQSEIIETAQHLTEWLGHMQNDDFYASELRRLYAYIKKADDLLIKVCEREGL